MYPNYGCEAVPRRSPSEMELSALLQNEIGDVAADRGLRPEGFDVENELIVGPRFRKHESGKLTKAIRLVFERSKLISE